MSTKLRSACDRCHESKIRCSGDVPCQGCLVSRSLCFYSVSHPLGRPRGTKKKQSRTGSRGSSTWNADEDSNGDVAATNVGSTGDRGTKQRSRARHSISGRKNNNSSKSLSRESAVSIRYDEAISDLLGASDSMLEHDPSFVANQPGHSNANFSDAIETHELRTQSLASTDHQMHGIDDTIPPYFDYSEVGYAIPDITQNDLNLITSPDTQSAFHWNDSINCMDSDNSSDLCQLTTDDVYTENLSTEFDEISQGAIPSRTRSNGRPDKNPSIQAHPTAGIPTNIPARTALSVAASPVVSSSCSCNCLQKHAEVLSNPILAEIRAGDRLDDQIWSMDKALCLGKQAMVAWQGLLSCPTCPYNDDQEVMILTFMSIRAVVQYLQRLSPCYARSTQSDGSSLQASTPLSQREESSLRIGFFEVEGDDRMIVLRTLYENLLRNVKSILQSLQIVQSQKKQRLLEKTQKKGVGVNDYQASSSLFHVQQISHGLITSLQALETSLKA